MTKNLLIACGLGVVLVACQSSGHAQGQGTIYNELVVRAVQQHDDSDTHKRATVEFQSGATAQNCREYLRLLATSTLKEDVNNQTAKGEYLMCEVLSIIGDRKLAAGRRDVALGQALATRLDLRSFPSSLFQTLDQQRHFLVDFDPKTIKLEPNSATYETKDWYLRIELIATQDVNHNGKLDWVLWSVDESKTGNYRQYQTLIVQDVDKVGRLVAVPFDVRMSRHG